MRLQIPPGLRADLPLAAGDLYWRVGTNVRFDANGLLRTVGPDMRAPDTTDPLFNTYALLWVGTPNWRVRTAYTATLSGLTSERSVMLFGATGLISSVQQENFSSGAPTGDAAWRVRTKTPTTSFTAPTDPSWLSTEPFYGVDVVPRWNFASASNAIFAVISSGVTGLGDGVSNPLFSWDLGAGTIFQPVAGSPAGATAVALTDDQIVLLLGAVPAAGTGSPLMTIRWTGRADPTDWTPGTTTIAGDQLLRIGSKIVGGGNTGRGIVCWTDEAMYRITELNDGNFIFRPDVLAAGGAGLIGNGAWTEADGKVFYIGNDMQPRMWDGAGPPLKIDCPLRSISFDTVYGSRTGEITAWADPSNTEVGWSLPSGAPARHVVYNYALDVWSMRSLDAYAMTPGLGGLIPAYVLPTGEMRFHDVRWPSPEIDPGTGASFQQGTNFRGPYINHQLVERSWSVSTNRWLAAADEQDAALMAMRLYRTLLPSNYYRRAGSSPAPFRVTHTAWGDIDGPSHAETFDIAGYGTPFNVRNHGRGLQMTLSSIDPDLTIRTFGTHVSSVEAGVLSR